MGARYGRSLSDIIYNIDEKKKLTPTGATVCVELTCSPHVNMGFLWVPQLPPTSQRCACQIYWCVEGRMGWLHSSHLLLGMLFLDAAVDKPPHWGAQGAHGECEQGS